MCTSAIFRIQITTSLSDEDAVYLIENICLRSPYVQQGTYDPLLFSEVLQLTREDRHDDRFAVCV